MQPKALVNDPAKGLEKGRSLINGQVSTVRPRQALAPIHVEGVGIDSPTLFDRLIELSEGGVDLLTREGVIGLARRSLERHVGPLRSYVGIVWSQSARLLDEVLR